jgi:hypothetical protein
MVATKRRSPTSTLVSKDAISGASNALNDLPEKPKEIWSLREAINLLKDQITTALDRGYTYTEVSQMLSTKGVEISPSTLKYYLSAARKEDGGGKTKTRRRRRTLTMSAEALKNGSVALEAATPETAAKAPAEAKPKRTRSTTAKTTTKAAPAKAPAKTAAKAKPAAAAKTKAAPKTTKSTAPKTTRKKAAG